MRIISDETINFLNENAHSFMRFCHPCTIVMVCHSLITNFVSV